MVATMDPNYGYVQSSPQNIGGFSKKTIIIIASLAFAIIIAIVLLVSSSQSGTAVQSQRLIVRYDNLQALLSDTETTRNLKNQDLSNIVKSFELTTTTDINDLKIALASQLPEKISESVVAAEADTSTAQTIEDAYLENKLDAVYGEVLIKKIDSIRALIAEIYGLSKDQNLKALLVEIDDHLRTTKQQTEELSL